MLLRIMLDNNFKLIKRGILSIAMILTSPLSAAPALDPTAPIQIQADNASVDQLSRQATHEGNVVLTQGNHILHANKLITIQDNQGRLSSITANGNPATFEGKWIGNAAPVFGSAKIIHYYPDKQLLILEGDATLEHQKDKFQGPSLTYHLDTQVISATKKSNERPTITLYPHA